MNLIGKLQPVIIITAALLGLLLGAVTPFGSVSSGLIEVFLMLLLYILFLSIDLKQIKKSFTNVRFTLSAVVINFVFTPPVRLPAGQGVLPRLAGYSHRPADVAGDSLHRLVSGVQGLSKGNVELGMSILPLNLILQIVLLPVYLLVLIGSEVTMDVSSLVSSVAMVLVIPFVLAYITKLMTKNSEKFKVFLSEQGDNLQLLFLCLAVVVMFASEGKNLLDNPLLLAQMFIPLLIFFAVLFFVAQLVGRLMKFPKKDIVALNMTTLARNSPLSLAIAVVTFPEQPLVSLALVIGPLIELPVLSVISGILKRWNQE